MSDTDNAIIIKNLSDKNRLGIISTKTLSGDLSRLFGKLLIILAAREISLVSMSISADLAKALIIGNNEYVASNGASSVFVYIILDFVMIALSF